MCIALYVFSVVILRDGRRRDRGRPFDCDFVVSGDRIVLIEMTPRIGGNSLSKLFQAALNYDWMAYAVTHACSDAPPGWELYPPNPMILTILGTDRSGRLTWDEHEASALRAEPWVQHLILDLPQGANVEQFINGRHRVGEALINGADCDEVDGRLAELNRRLALTAL
jgi:hypothetical protein